MFQGIFQVLSLNVNSKNLGTLRYVITSGAFFTIRACYGQSTVVRQTTFHDISRSVGTFASKLKYDVEGYHGSYIQLDSKLFAMKSVSVWRSCCIRQRSERPSTTHLISFERWRHTSSSIHVIIGCFSVGSHCRLITETIL